MIDLTVKTLDSQNHAFSLEDDQITVRGFKEYIAESVAVPADSQRLIYCGRVLQDEKKLNDYDVNGKVIHLVQRAPPQPGQRGNDGGQSQGQNHGSHGWQNSQRTHYRLTRTQMHGNAMYLGAMSVPAEIVEGHGLALPLFSNSLSNGRLIAARHMLERIDRLIDRLDNPSRPVNPSSSENSRPALGELMQESEPEQFNNEGRANNGAILAEAAAAAIVAALSAAGANNQLEIVGSIRAGGSDENAEARPAGEVSEDNQPEPQLESQPQQPQTEQQGSTSNSDEQPNRRSSPQLPRPPQLSELLDLLLATQARLRPHTERYCKLMRDDPALPPGSRVEENQRFVDTVSECLHYTSHACHALSDIIVDMNQQPPRNLRCRPIIIQRSAILQHGTPLQVEAHISVHGRNANNNNGNEESGDAANSASQPSSAEGNVGNSTEQQEPESAAQQQPDQQPEQTQSPFGTVFNLPNNVEVLMEVSPESNIDAASGSEQAQPGENNNNNNNNNNNVGGRVRGPAGAFTWGSSPAPDFIRNLMQAVAGRIVQSGMTNTTITTRNPVTVGQQNVTSMDSGSTNAGQSTQARSNVGTHPTTATQTRSTSRPHVFQPQALPLGMGMSIAQAFDFDPFLPCNSHHVRRTSSTNSNPVTSMSQSTQTSQTTTSETRPQTQTATTSSATSNTSSTNTTASTTSQTNTNDPFMFLPQELLGGRSGQPPASISINSDNPDLAESLRNIMQLFGDGNIHVGIVEDDTPIEEDLIIADFFERSGIPMSDFTSRSSDSEGNLLVDLIVVVIQNMTWGNLISIQGGHLEQIAVVRRPLQEYLQHTFPNTTPEALQEQATERLLSQLRPDFQTLFASEETVNIWNGPRIDICATVEALFRRHIKDMLQILFNNDIDSARFGPEIVNTLNTLGRQLYAILRCSTRDGQARLEVLVSRFLIKAFRGAHPALRHSLQHNFIIELRLYSASVPLLPESEILPLLVYEDVPSQPPAAPSAPTRQSSQVQPEVEPMETETVEERTTFEASLPDDGEESPRIFAGIAALPSDWVPIINRDCVRQQRQLKMQEINGDVATFSDAYLGTLPTKRRKLIEQQKPRLLVSPTPNNSAIAASMERLVREGVTRAGVEEVEGAAVAVAVDPGVRRAFGQAIRDCLNPRRYGTPDFPDPLRFPNATKYFSDQDRSPK